MSVEVMLFVCLFSAADWYISEHLQPFIRGSSSNKSACRLLRIYFNKRNIATIDENVLPYVLKDGKNLRYPSRAGMDCLIREVANSCTAGIFIWDNGIYSL